MNLNDYEKKYYNEADDEQESEYDELNVRKKNKYNNNYKNNSSKKNNIIYSSYEIFLMIIIILIFISCIILFLFSFYEQKNNFPNYNSSKFLEIKKQNGSIINSNNETQNNISNTNNIKINNILNQNITNNDTKINNDIFPNINNNTKIANINMTIKNDIKINNEINNNTAIQENNRIAIAFMYKTLYANGIARFITVTADYLIETGKYDIYIITEKGSSYDYKFNNKIKRVFIYGNHTLMSNFTKHHKIDFFILQNLTGKQTAAYYRQLGKKVIGMFHGVYMSAMFHGGVSSYTNWELFDTYDAFIFISYDDYFFYKKLGYKNEIFIPNLYTFEPSKTPSSNLTNHNIMMLGRATDPVKGFRYAILTMPYIVKEVPDAILHIVSSNYNLDVLKNLTAQLNVTKNVRFNTYTENITKVFLNSSICMYTSLSEAFPMAMNEAKSYGLPIVAFNVQYSIPYQDGVINVDMLDLQALANETIKLLKDYEYRKKMGEWSKLSLNQFSNNETVELWGRLFNALLEGEGAYRKLQNEIENKYYNEERARLHMEQHYKDLLRFNKNFTCHTINNFTDINYVRNITMCPYNTNSSTLLNQTSITNFNSTDLITNSNITFNQSNKK